jgi:hypothetical protein
MYVQWDIQALRLRERDHIELLAVQILPRCRANGIRNEDILHTGDQVSPASQTVAGPRATRRALNRLLGMYTQVHDTAFSPSGSIGSQVRWRSCNANSASSLSSAARLDACALHDVTRARSICGTRSGGGRCRVIGTDEVVAAVTVAKLAAAAGTPLSTSLELCCVFTALKHGPEAQVAHLARTGRCADCIWGYAAAVLRRRRLHLWRLACGPQGQLVLQPALQLPLVQAVQRSC